MRGRLLKVLRYISKPSLALFSLANTGFPVLRNPYDIYIFIPIPVSAIYPSLHVGQMITCIRFDVLQFIGDFNVNIFLIFLNV